MASPEKGLANRGFQEDEIELRSYNDPYHIPRVPDRRGLQLSHLKSPRSYSPTTFDEIRRPASKDRNGIDYPVEIYEIEGKEERHPDYSLLGIIKRTKCYENLKAKFPFLKNPKWMKYMFLFLLLLLYIAYFVFVIIIHSKIQEEDYWCRGDGFLIIITSFFAIGLVYFQIFKPYFLKRLCRNIKRSSIFKKSEVFYDDLMSRWYIKLFLYFLVTALIVGYLIYDSGGNPRRLFAILGIACFLLFGFVFSKAPLKIIWRHVIWGMSLQFLLGLLILKWPVGEAIFDCLGSKIQIFLEFTDKGSSFVFGELVSEYGIFTFKVLSVIIFFSLFIQILYFYGIMQWIVVKLGWLLQITVGTTACESVNASANIFLGQTEAPLLIKPFLKDMTNSELHAVMTGGFATIAGTVLAAYISFGVEASHLLSASVMSAPAALAYSKLFYPETEISKTSASSIRIEKPKETNALHAALEGVTTAIPLVANIAANLLAFIAFIAFIDSILNWICLLVDVGDGVCSLSNIFGYVFMPVAWLMGVAWKDCYYVGQLIGTKTIVNEFVAYIELRAFVKANLLMKRSEIIATYALCGFSNISSIGIQLGALSAMAPSRRGDLSKIAFRAMVAGNIACFLTACIAGSLISIEDTGEHYGNFSLSSNQTNL